MEIVIISAFIVVFSIILIWWGAYNDLIERMDRIRKNRKRRNSG